MVKKHTCKVIKTNFKSNLSKFNSFPMSNETELKTLARRIRRKYIRWKEININGLPTFTFLKLSDRSFLHAQESCYNTGWFTMVLNTIQGNLCPWHYFENSSLNSLCISKQNNFLKTQFKFHLLHTAYRTTYNKLALREPLCCSWYSTFIFLLHPLLKWINPAHIRSKQYTTPKVIYAPSLLFSFQGSLK